MCVYWLHSLFLSCDSGMTATCCSLRRTWDRFCWRSTSVMPCSSPTLQVEICQISIPFFSLLVPLHSMLWIQVQRSKYSKKLIWFGLKKVYVVKSFHSTVRKIRWHIYITLGGRVCTLSLKLTLNYRKTCTLTYTWLKKYWTISKITIKHTWWCTFA